VAGCAAARRRGASSEGSQEVPSFTSRYIFEDMSENSNFKIQTSGKIQIPIFKTRVDMQTD